MNIPSSITHSGIHPSGILFRKTSGLASLYLIFKAFVVLLFCPLSGMPLLSASARGMEHTVQQFYQLGVQFALTISSFCEGTFVQLFDPFLTGLHVCLLPFSQKRSIISSFFVGDER